MIAPGNIFASMQNSGSDVSMCIVDWGNTVKKYNCLVGLWRDAPQHFYPPFFSCLWAVPQIQYISPHSSNIRLDNGLHQHQFPSVKDIKRSYAQCKTAKCKCTYAFIDRLTFVIVVKTFVSDIDSWARTSPLCSVSNFLQFQMLTPADEQPAATGLIAASRPW